MIEIRNDTGLSLHLLTGQVLTTEQPSGWLSDDELPGAFSYPISFPLSDHNERFLGGAFRPGARLASGAVDGQLPVSVALDGVLYRRAMLAYKVGEGKGDGYLKLDAGEAYDRLRQQSLRSVVAEKIELLPAGSLPGNWPTSTYPISHLGQRLAEIARMAPGVFPFTYFPIRNEGFFEKDLDAAKVSGFTRQPYLNAWSVATQSFAVDAQNRIGTGVLRGWPMAPQPYLSYILGRIFSHIGWQLTGDWLGNEETGRLVVLNGTALPTARTSSYSPLTVDTGLIVPDVSVADFLKAIRTRYGLVLTGNSTTRTMSIRRFVDVARQSATVDYTRFRIGNWGMDPADGAGFAVVDFVDSNDELGKDPVTKQTLTPKPLVVGKGGNRIDLKVGTTALQRHRYAEVTGEFTNIQFDWLVPAVSQPGLITDAAYGKSERYWNPNATDAPGNGSIRLLSYRGLVSSPTGRTYPLASPDVRDGRQRVVAGVSTALGGRYGIWNGVLQPYYSFRDRTRRVTTSLLMPVADFSRIRLDGPIRLALDDEAALTLLPEKVQAELPSLATTGSSGLVKVRLTALTLPDDLGETLPEETVVWVELIVEARPKIHSSPVETHPETDNAGNTYNQPFTYSLDEIRATIRARVWADENRTTPATVLQPGGGEFDGIVVNIRKGIKTTNQHTDSSIVAGESITQFLLLTADQILDNNAVLLRHKYLVNFRGQRTENYTVTYTLDPGDSYNTLF